MNEKTPHIPVLLHEVLDCFEAMPKEGVFIDCTLGYGGHSEAILKKFPDIRLIGIDQDPEAIAFASKRLARFAERFEARRGRFSDLLPQLLNLPVCGILADFGVSSLQLDKKERGFSFLSENLDMRMNPEGELNAYDVVNTYPQHELERIFREFGEERAWRKAAKAIVDARAKKPIESGIELSEILGRVIPKRGKNNPATALFQAIRIEVNDELGEIVRLLDALEAQPPRGAVVGLITFHSLEDRLVKQRFKAWSTSCICPPEAFRCTCGNDHALGRALSRKPFVASADEVRENPRSRSAKLRCFQFFGEMS
ncbi:16S rRNA (cytosine(1402)-N(4))-methyltransferase RsmH [Hydrogenimonas cancrithermarum]|uniref:Ribosomal RNA small subunit methyltransferase H n=1 Tax=Hydrogenimonas cancrithermarum TaxID=2993563 RepID=A0ABM8FL24_9BACT|nr:16S rRNA (cytosine(1402)-N(4))-methyltransferase RsmH [Hydrogenimonas cancrithermarum]BDY12112.1 ribosomal RNA small subunit methyltransferase H [Hydrogenimonas cancrithermarum]